MKVEKKWAVAFMKEVEAVLNKQERSSEELCEVYAKLRDADAKIGEDRSLLGYYLKLAQNKIKALYRSRLRRKSDDALYDNLLDFLRDIERGYAKTSVSDAVTFALMLVESWTSLIELNKYQLDTMGWQDKIAEVEDLVRRVEPKRVFEEEEDAAI